MDKETYERQKAFAGEKKPSMQRRCVGHDYTERRMYMITMVVEGRRPLFGQVVGRSDGEKGSKEEARVELTELGKRVEKNWYDIATRHPEIEVIALQMMPDHLHGILFVREKMEKHLGQVLSGFKSGCNKDYRELVLGVESVAAMPRQTEPTSPQQTGQREQTATTEGNTRTRPPRSSYSRSHGFLFAPGYNDKILLRDGQLEIWKHYLAENPRRLLMKREHPDLFRVQRGLKVGSHTFSAIGNRFLLQKPVRVQVQCSRRLTDDEIQAKVQQCLSLARRGAVLVSPSISKGEKAVMRAAFEAGFPLIYLQENGFTDLAKPGGARMEACARGQLLILAPWEHHNEQTTISRTQCLTLNELAKEICINSWVKAY